MSAETIHILVVDDDPADVELLRDHMESAAFEHTLDDVRDGVEALAYLRGEGEHAQARRPHLVLLDLNMPRMNGFETLEAIRGDAAFDDIKIIVLTTSASDADVERSFEMASNYFVTKPAEPEEFQEVIGIIRDFSAAYLSRR